MTITLVLLVLQICGALIAVIRDSGEDTRFTSEKLDYRS
jgi:hypothetical protein